MRVLVVAAQPPLPEGGAAGRTTVALLRGLARHGLDVAAIAPMWPWDRGAAPSDLPVELVPVTVAAGRGPAARGARLRHPISELAATEVRDRVRQVAGNADVVHFDQIETACLGPVPPTASLVHLHYRALLDAPLGPPWRAAGRHRALFALAERQAIHRFGWLLANSADVAGAIRRTRPSADVTVAPLPLDVDGYPAHPPVAEPVAGIIGTAGWAPTDTAIRTLLDRVWPAVAREVPDAALRIAGRGTESFHSVEPSVQVLGPVPSAAGFLAGIALLVYPAIRGSGTKVKVLEALASGVPVATFPAGAHGLDANDGLVVARSADELIRVVIRLLRDPAERAERGAAGRRYVKDRHAPGVATAAVIELYRRMTG